MDEDLGKNASRWMGLVNSCDLMVGDDEKARGKMSTNCQIV